MKTLFMSLFLFGLLIASNYTDSSINFINPVFQTLRNPLQQDTIIDFEKYEARKFPVMFSQTYTGKSQSLNWKIINDNGNKVAAQLAKNQGDYYNLLILKNNICLNFKASVKIKAIDGDEDQGGGLVWRYSDNNNYYIARYNPLENNLRFYRVVNGIRKQLKTTDSSINAGVWFTLSIEMSQSKIICSLNGVNLIETTDETFSLPGLIGFWTKADAVTYFDNLTISVLR